MTEYPVEYHELKKRYWRTETYLKNTFKFVAIVREEEGLKRKFYVATNSEKRFLNILNGDCKHSEILRIEKILKVQDD